MSRADHVSPQAAAAVMPLLPDGGRFVALDSWRGLAALGVVAFHVQGGGPLFDQAPFDRFNLLVDFFFVLSGFVLAAAYGERLAQGFSIGRYMLLRLGRIYPLHVVMVGAFLVLELGFALVGPDSAGLREPFTGDGSVERAEQTLLLIGPWFDPPLTMYNGPSWSIAVEFWLYLALALTLRAAPRLGWWLLPALSGVILAIEFNGAWPGFLPGQILRGAVGFGLGVATWRLWRALPPGVRAPRRPIATLAEVTVVAAMIGLLTFGDRLPPTNAVLLVVFALTVLVFAGERGLLSRILQRPAFVWLGVLSYSIYMVHLIVIEQLRRLLHWAATGDLTGSAGSAMLAADPWSAAALGGISIAACIPVAWLTWRFVEAPARAWSRRRAARWGVGREETAAPSL